MIFEEMLYEEPEMLVILFGKKNVVTASTLVGEDWEQPEDGFEFQ